MQWTSAPACFISSFEEGWLGTVGKGNAWASQIRFRAAWGESAHIRRRFTQTEPNRTAFWFWPRHSVNEPMTWKPLVNWKHIKCSRVESLKNVRSLEDISWTSLNCFLCPADLLSRTGDHFALEFGYWVIFFESFLVVFFLAFIHILRIWWRRTENMQKKKRKTVKVLLHVLGQAFSWPISCWIWEQPHLQAPGHWPAPLLPGFPLGPTSSQVALVVQST